jgi:predicted transcriptional regulator of viral defense system
MSYIEFSAILRKNKMRLFTLRDIKNLFPKEKEKTIKNNLARWVEQGYYRKLKRDLYEFIEAAEESKIPDLYVANRLYAPSYVSLETALSIYSIIPDVAASVTSVTTKATRRFKNRYGSFFYKTCAAKAFTGYLLMTYSGFKVAIADKEKALVDFLYYRSRSGFPSNFAQDRFNKTILKKIRWQRALYYAGLFNKTVVKTVKECRRYVKC